MIPLDADREARDYYVANIISVWWQASEDDWQTGAHWYETAHWIARELAHGDVKVGAGVIAALSPQTEWWLNVELASDAFEAGNATRHTGDSTGKANKIMAGIAPEDVLPMHKKTGHFYRAILNPDDPDAVCIDRHAHDVAVGVAYGSWSRGLETRRRYELIADCYREAAERLGTIPSVVQAVTWVAWRNGVRS